MGPNHVLDKGFYVDPASSAINFGWAAVYSAVSQGNAGVLGDTIKATPSAGDVYIVGVLQETLDAAKVSTGKASVGVRVLGISRCVSDGSTTIAPGDAVAVAADGRFKKTAGAVGSGSPIAGRAASPAAAVAGAVFDMLLTPGGNV